MTGLRSVYLYLQEIVQAYLKSTGLEKRILSMDIMYLEKIVLMIIHGVILASYLYSLTNQHAYEISATACLLEYLQS